jgi:hypothetical protein
MFQNVEVVRTQTLLALILRPVTATTAGLPAIEPQLLAMVGPSETFYNMFSVMRKTFKSVV